MTKQITFFALIGALLMLAPLSANAVDPTDDGCTELILDFDQFKIDHSDALPDFRAVVPDHINIQNKKVVNEDGSINQEWLRFSNGIADSGQGDWRMVPLGPITPDATEQDTRQHFIDSNGDCVGFLETASFVFHPEHNHWHMSDVVEFSVRQANVDESGPDMNDNGIVGISENKVTFCIEDVYNMIGNTNTKDREYWDCATSLQGMQAGWSDQYHQSREGNQVPIDSLENDTDYYLVHFVNFAGLYGELDDTNNIAWQKFQITDDGNGNRKLVLLENSCEVEGSTVANEQYGFALCAGKTLNRG